MVFKGILSLSVCACGVAAALGILFCGSTARADVVVDWTFNSTLNDSSGNNNNGSMNTGTANYVTLAGTNGISLTGINLASNQGVFDNSATNLPTLGGDPWTMNLWFNLSSAMGNLATVGGFGGPDAGLVIEEDDRNMLAACTFGRQRRHSDGRPMQHRQQLAHVHRDV